MLKTTTIEGLEHQMHLWANETQDASIAMVGPLGSGKTYGLAVKQALLRARNRGTDGLLVVPSYPIARKVHFKDWPAAWATLGIKVVHERANNAWLWPWGDRTWIGTADNPESLVGPNLGDVTFDEPGLMDREANDRAAIRARHPKAKVRQKIYGGTPEGINWFADLFASPKKPYHTIFARTWHPDMAHYPAQLKEQYGYDESLLDAYARGKFVPLRVGRCYRPFDRAVHESEHARYDSSLPLVLCCDFNVDAMRWEVVQFHPYTIDVIDEISMGLNSDTEMSAKEFCRRWGCRHSGQVIITGDRSGKSRSTSGKTDYQILFKEIRKTWGSTYARIPSENPLIKDRVATVNYNLSGNGGRTVRINRKCKELMLDCERVVWRQGVPEEDKSDPQRTHAASALGYGMWIYARPKSIGSGGSSPVRGTNETGIHEAEEKW